MRRALVGIGTCIDPESLLSIDKVEVSGEALARLKETRKEYLAEASRRRIYGYCTGLGELQYKITRCPDNWEMTVLDEHSTSVGLQVSSRSLSLLFLKIRLLQLLQAPAPVRPGVAQRIAVAVNRGIAPLIHAYGSVGASGDLAPSSEAFRCLFYGKGRAWADGKPVPCRSALEKAGLDVYPLQPGEALALINNTAWSTALCSYNVTGLKNALNTALELAVRLVTTVKPNPEHYMPKLLELKRCPRCIAVAYRLNSQCAGKSRLLQYPYSIRCLPQILGSLFDGLDWVEKKVAEEACSSTENPTVINGRVYHNCNFHSIRVSLACDQALTIAGHLASLVDRLAAQLMRKSITGLPEFVSTEHSSVGLMIVQYATASLAARARTLSHPSGVESIPTSGLQEDIVPMTPISGLKLYEQVEGLGASLALLQVILDKIDEARRGPLSFNSLQEDVITAYRRMLARLYPYGLPFTQDPDYGAGKIPVE